MSLAEGDMVQYAKIKEGSIGDYLIKLNNHVEGIERQIEQNKQRPASASRK